MKSPSNNLKTKARGQRVAITGFVNFETTTPPPTTSTDTTSVNPTTTTHIFGIAGKR